MTAPWGEGTGESGSHRARIDEERKAGQQARRLVGLAEGDLDGLLPAAAALAVDGQRRLKHVRERIDDPVFADAGDLAVEFDVARLVFLLSALGEDFDDEERL